MTNEREGRICNQPTEFSSLWQQETLFPAPLSYSKGLFANLASKPNVNSRKPEPIRADAWIVSSILQKSIRRAEPDIAERAALTLLSLRGSAIWPRFIIIAFEDIGVGSPDALAMAVAVASDPAFRREIGGNAVAARVLARLLCGSAKDRSADYIAWGPKKFHTTVLAAPSATLTSSLQEQLRLVADQNASPLLRSAAAWYACGLGWPREKGGDLSALLQTYRNLGVPEILVEATGIAAKRTREPMVAIVPLVWLVANTEQKPTIEQYPIPPLVLEGDVPLYALDMHTRPGREAIFRFAQNNLAARECLNRYTVGSQRQAAYLAAFYTDGSPIAPRLMWDGSKETEQAGIRNDFLQAGVTLEGVEPILEVFRENLAELNQSRREAFGRSREVARTAP
jgi:hypothetical protein